MASYRLTDPGYTDRFRQGRNVWKIVVPSVLLLLALGVWALARAVQRGSHEAYELAKELHAQVAAGDWNGIYDGASEEYRRAISRSDSQLLFAGVVRKLGTPQACKQGGTTLNANTSGNTIVSECDTTFSSGAQAQETFTWLHEDGRYRLEGYRVASRAFLTN